MNERIEQDLFETTKVGKRKIPKKYVKNDNISMTQNEESEDHRKSKEPIPVRKMCSTVSQAQHGNVPHMWLCNGRLLVLIDPAHQRNINLFKVID